MQAYFKPISLSRLKKKLHLLKKSEILLSSTINAIHYIYE